MQAQLDRDIFGNLLSRKEPAGTRRHYHFDGLGSTTALSDEGGAAVATLLYDAWGNQRTASGATMPNYRFTGAELDSASGLYHMGARFYDPTIGRWLSEDPLQDQFFDPDSLNFYAYVSGNPSTLIDPDGTTAAAPAILLGLVLTLPALGPIGPSLLVAMLVLAMGPTTSMSRSSEDLAGWAEELRRATQSVWTHVNPTTWR